MRVNFSHLIDGKIKVGSRVIDLYNLQIRDELSLDSIKKYAVECAEKIKSDPRFDDEQSKRAVETFYKDLLESVQFFPTEPKWIDTARIYSKPKRSDLPKAVITIPSDFEPTKAKVSSYHETIHYFLENYYPILTWDENLVDKMVDFYLHDDAASLFEHRWLHYSLTPKMKIVKMSISGVVGALIGTGIGSGHPEISLASIVGSIGVYKLFKKMKKKSLVP